MAYRLTRPDVAKKANLVNDLREAHGELDQAIIKFNGLIEDAKAFVEGVAAEWRAEFDDKTEEWQGSDRGQEVETMINDWENMEFFDAEAAPDDPSDALEELADNVDN